MKINKNKTINPLVQYNTPDKRDNKTKVKYIFGSFVPFTMSIGLLISVMFVYIIVAIFSVAYIFSDIISVTNYEDFTLFLTEFILSEQSLIMIQILWTFVAYIIFGTWYKKKHATFTKPPSIIDISEEILTTIFLFFLTASIILTVERFAPSLINQYNDLLSFEITPLFIFYSVVMAPIFEETMFRGLIQGIAKKGISTKAAIILQAVLFGVMHANLIQGLYAFILGIYFGYLKEKYQTIAVPILLHMIFNSINYIPTYIVIAFVGAITLFCVYRSEKKQNQYAEEKEIFTKTHKALNL